MTQYNQSGYIYNQSGAIYNQVAITRTATGSGLGDSTVTQLALLKQTATGSGIGAALAATKVTQLRLEAHSDFDFPYYTGGRFYIGAPIVARSANGSGAGTETASNLHIAPRSATGSGAGTSNNTIVVGFLRTGYGSGGATAGDTANGNVNPVRTATGSGSSGFDATGLHIAPRTASASGAGTSTTLGLHVAPRTATGIGEGTATASRLVTSFRTASGEGTGAQSAFGAIIFRREADGSGVGDYVPSEWVKSHIFRVPITEGYPFAIRLSDAAPDRLFAHTPQGVRAKNLYRLADGSYTTTDPRRPELITRTYFGGHDNFLTDPEITELTAAGYGSSIT